MNNTAGKLQVMLVDDHRCLSEGLARLLNEENDIYVCGLASNLEEASKVFIKAKPDIVLLDLNLGENESGFTFLEKAKSSVPDIRVIIVSTFDGATYRNLATSMGADDYIAKGASVAEIVKSIRRAANADARKPGLVQSRQKSPQAARVQLYKDLSESEKRVLCLLIDGFSQKEIAAKLKLSASTVGTYVSRAREKFGAKSLAHLVSIAETLIERDDDHGVSR